MSYDIIQSIKNNLPSTVVHGVDEETRALAGGTGSGGKRISIKGGVFRKIVNGKEVGSVDERFLDVIFVRVAKDPSRTFYDQGYKEDKKISPACWSTDSKTPDPEVKNPVAPKCESCPMSVKGSGAGGNGSACRLQWRSAVVLPSNPEGDVFQLVLPATSCFGKEENGKYPLRAYGQFLANNNVSISNVVTKVAFDTKSPVPRVLFSPVMALDQETIDVVAEQKKTPAAESAIKLTVYQQDGGDTEVVEEAVVQKAEAPKKSLKDMYKKTAKEEVVEDTPEPVVREASKPKSEPTGGKDIQSLVSKWSKKKG